jgi:hypothetical protein
MRPRSCSSVSYLPSLDSVPVWDFQECLDRMRITHGRRDLADDLDLLAERQLCTIAEKEYGIAAVFVTGFPLTRRRIAPQVSRLKSPGAGVFMSR